MKKLIFLMLVFFIIKTNAQNLNDYIGTNSNSNSLTQPQKTPICTPIECDLIINGGFEEFSGIPTNIAQIHLACGWDDNNSTTADYYHSNSINQNTSIPCNEFGFQQTTPGNINYPVNNAYAGMLILKNNPGEQSLQYYETIHTKLKEPLLPNTKYQLSFDVSLAEGASSSAIIMQAYLSTNLVSQINDGGDLIFPTGSGILLPNQTFSSNFLTWEKITITFTTGNISGEEYLYLGGLLDVQSITNNPANSSEGCQYSDYSNSQIALTYYYIDNVELVETNEVSLSLPPIVSNNQILSNLAQYVSPNTTNGVFSGVGITNIDGIYIFESNAAGVHTITYTFNNSGCQTSLYFNITVVCENPPVIPTFEHINPICFQSLSDFILPTTSINGISGSWTPQIVNLTTTTTYIFTPDAGFCALNGELTITILPIGNTECDGKCISNIILSNPETNINYNYKAVSIVELNTNYSITGVKNINMTAGKLILLKPNTFIGTESNFYAKIEPCSYESSKVVFETKVVSEKASKSTQELKSEFILYPNPTDSYVTVFSEDLFINEISVISMYGNEVYRKKIENSSSYEVNVSNFPKGIYLVNIQTSEGKTATKKLVIR